VLLQRCGSVLINCATHVLLLLPAVHVQDISVSGMRLNISRLVANETNDTPPMGMTAQVRFQQQA
jgi:hypothetical protein